MLTGRIRQGNDQAVMILHGWTDLLTFTRHTPLVVHPGWNHSVWRMYIQRGKI
jgi:hypothetical protein